MRRTRVGRSVFGSMTISADNGILASISRMPPLLTPVAPALVWRFTTLRPSTVAAPSLGNTCLTMPRRPLSLPRRSTTVSPLTILGFATPCRFIGLLMLEHLRRQRGDLQETAVAQLAAHGPEHARAARVQVVLVALDAHARVLVEADHGAVGTAQRRGRTDHDRLDDLSLLHGRARDRALHGADDDVADVRVLVARTAADVDAQQLARARVVGHFEPCLLLNHSKGAPSRTPRPPRKAWGPRSELATTVRYAQYAAALAPSARCSFSPLEDLDQTPALVARHRAALLDAHQIARLRVVLLVVRLEARRLADDFLVDGVRHARLRHDHDGLVHLVALDAALLDAPAVAALHGGRCGVGLHGVRLLHDGPRRSSSRRSRFESGRRC